MLNGKSIIVTGAAQGIGAVMAAGFAKMGAQVALSDIDDAGDAAERINGTGGAAIAVQAVVFGAAHAAPVFGMGNIGLVIVLSGVGAALGVGTYLLRRIGPAIIAHAIFNAVVVTLILTGVADQLTE